MSEPAKIPQRQALRLLFAAVAGDEPASSFIEIRTLRPGGQPGPRRFVPVRDLELATATALSFEGLNVYFGACPRVREGGRADDVERGRMVWADCDTPAAVAALIRFKPAPSIIWRTSPGRLQAAWPLSEPLSPSWVRRANRRIAHTLGADMASTDPARVLRAIGTRSMKYSPPPLVTCVKVETDVFDVREIVGELPDPPERRLRSVDRAQPTHRPGSAQAALAGAARVVAEAPEGTRSNRLNWAAYVAAERIASGELCEDDVRAALTAAAERAGLPAAEIAGTLHSGLRAGKAAA